MDVLFGGSGDIVHHRAVGELASLPRLDVDAPGGRDRDEEEENEANEG
jgi:hypothetical protein